MLLPSILKDHLRYFQSVLKKKNPTQTVWIKQICWTTILFNEFMINIYIFLNHVGLNQQLFFHVVFCPFFLDPAVHLRLLGISCSLQLHHPYLTLRYCGDAEVSRLLFYWLGLGPLPRREWPEGPGQHFGPQWGAGAGMNNRQLSSITCGKRVFCGTKKLLLLLQEISFCHLHKHLCSTPQLEGNMLSVRVI